MQSLPFALRQPSLAKVVGGIYVFLEQDETSQGEVNQREVRTLDGLHGFLFGLAITPELILSSEWLPVIFGEGGEFI